MRQIIVDFGTLDVSAFAGILQICALAMAAALGLVLGQLIPWRFVQSGQDPRPLLRWAGYALGAELLLVSLSLVGRGVSLAICGYLLAFTAAFLVSLLVVLRRLLKAARLFESDPAGARAATQSRLTLLGPGLLAGLSVPLLIGALALVAADAVGYKASPRIYGYGLMLVLGFLSGVYLGQWRARRMGESTEAVAAIGALSLVGGVVGARVAYVIENWSEFTAAGNLLPRMLNVTSGGLIYYGGVILATAMVLIYLRAKRLPIRRYLDLIAPSMMIGLAFGRAGCTLNGCCWGGPARDDWALHTRFPMYSKPLIKLDGRDNPFSQAAAGPGLVYAAQMAPKRHAPARLHPPRQLLDETGRLVLPRDFTPAQIAMAESQKSLPVKPAQVLGMANAALLAGLLVAFSRIRRREGQVFALLMIVYPITRFILESIRADNPHYLANLVLTHNQYSSLVMMLAGLALWAWLGKLPASAGATYARRLADAESAGPDADSAKRTTNLKKRSKSNRKG